MADTLSMEQRENLVQKLYNWVEAADQEIAFSPGRNRFDTMVANKELKVILNELFPDATCTDVKITMNYDNLPFYIVVEPTLPENFLYRALYNDETYLDSDCTLRRYAIELDSKLFAEFDNAQITEIILYSIYQVISPNLIHKVTRGIEASLLASTSITPSDRYIKLRDLRENVGLFTYAIIMYINQITSIGNLPYNDPTELDAYLNMHVMDGINIFGTVVNQVCGKVNAELDDQSQHPAVQILDWLMSVQIESELHTNDIIHTLDQARKFTASQSIKETITNTISMVKGDTHEAMVRKARLQESLISLTEGFSLFKSLKMNGLRSIEDDLYEYRIRIKNCEEEEEAMYILRQINTRMAILDDYMRNTEISQREMDRWTSVMDSYRSLRAELGKKKLGPKKQYGIFIDYDKIDQME